MIWDARSNGRREKGWYIPTSRGTGDGVGKALLWRWRRCWRLFIVGADGEAEGRANVDWRRRDGGVTGAGQDVSGPAAICEAGIHGGWMMEDTGREREKEM